MSNEVFLRVIEHEPIAGQSGFPTLSEEFPDRNEMVMDLRYVIDVVELSLHLLAI